MSNSVNQHAYQLWAPIYDLLFRTISLQARTRAIDLLRLEPGESLLIPGIGTGLDLPLLPAGVFVTGLDFSPAMLARARRKVRDDCTSLLHGDAGQLPFEDASFDALLFNLVLSVVPRPVQAFRECWRVLRPRGRAVIFDKFLPEHGTLTRRRQLAGRVIRMFGTDPNRRFGDIIAGIPDVHVILDCPSLLHGQYRILLLNK